MSFLSRLLNHLNLRGGSICFADKSVSSKTCPKIRIPDGTTTHVLISTTDYFFRSVDPVLFQAGNRNVHDLCLNFVRHLFQLKRDHKEVREVYISFDNMLALINDSKTFRDTSVHLKNGACDQRRICNVGYDDYKGGLVGLISGLSRMHDRSFFIYYLTENLNRIFWKFKTQPIFKSLAMIGDSSLETFQTFNRTH